jgi:hypothetical protein
MIVSAEHDFSFVHIPKCAGSTIRHPLRDKDDFDGRFYRSIEHPDLGLINGNHIPLDVLRTHFPDAFEALRRVTSYTITRDPMKRFVSGIAQHIRDGGGEPAGMDDAEILALAHGVIDYMQALEGMPDFRHTLFIRQESYIRIGRTRIIDHVFAMERMDAVFDVLERRHDLHLNRDSVWNPTVTYRFPKHADKLKAAKDMARRILPVGAYARLRDVSIGVLTTRGVSNLNETIENDPKVQEFVRSYYAADSALHEKALESTR